MRWFPALAGFAIVYRPVGASASPSRLCDCRASADDVTVCSMPCTLRGTAEMQKSVGTTLKILPPERGVNTASLALGAQHQVLLPWRCPGFHKKPDHRRTADKTLAKQELLHCAVASSLRGAFNSSGFITASS